MRTAVPDPRVLRRHILSMAHRGRSAHVGCALSLVEICAALFGGVMRYDRFDPLAPERDLLVLSKGHGVMALYACFRELGWVGDEDLRNYLTAFGFDTVECDGHDMSALAAALDYGEDEQHRPRALIARTVKGCGVSFMAADNRWHYARLNDTTLAAALEEIR